MSHEPAALRALPLLLLAAPLASAAPGVCEGDEAPSWPQWDGPRGDNLAHETGWEPEGRSLWEFPVGLGYSSVAVHGGRLYTMGYDEEAGLDVVWCLDALTGDEVWAHTYPSAIWNEAHRGGTVNTPSVDPFLDGAVVYTLNREGNLYALDAATGEVKWHVDVTADEELAVRPPRWGFSASPVVLEDRLVLNCGKVLSVDKATGEVHWASRDYGQAYGTPKVLAIGDERAAAVLNGGGIGVVTLAEGKELYSSPFGTSQNGVNPATPIAIDDAMFVSAGSTGACALLAFGDGELIPVWEGRGMRNSMSGCVRIGDHLYGFDQAVLKCIGLDGSEAWVERGLGNGALTATPERLIVLTGEGELIVAAASPEGFEPLSRAKLFEDGELWTKPILAGGVVYCRNSDGILLARDHRPTED